MKGKKARPLRSGYTTGAVAAAASKAAAIAIKTGEEIKEVTITFPDGNPVTFKVNSLRAIEAGRAAECLIEKDAGDDPDVTNHALIGARVEVTGDKGRTSIKGGEGVGRVTRPGLPVKPGRPAINPVPARMIRRAVAEARAEAWPSASPAPSLRVTIFVPEGERLSEKTLNHRLGIVGGISILGTTGYVRPLSAEAWTATISSSLDVARASGFREVLLSSGRTSERAAARGLGFSETACVMMGDHVAWSLERAGAYSFDRLHLAAQWAKILKIAKGTPDTHVRAGALGGREAADFLRELGVEIEDRDYNSAREIYDLLSGTPEFEKAASALCRKAAGYASSISGKPVTAHLVSYDGVIISSGKSKPITG